MSNIGESLRQRAKVHLIGKHQVWFTRHDSRSMTTQDLLSLHRRHHESNRLLNNDGGYAVGAKLMAHDDPLIVPKGSSSGRWSSSPEQGDAVTPAKAPPERNAGQPADGSSRRSAEVRTRATPINSDGSARAASAP